MKSVKILLVGVLSFIMLGAVSVNAMTAKELEEKLTKSYTINGTTWAATADQKVEIERYFRTNKVSDEDAKYISDKVDDAISIIKESKATKLEDIPAAYKSELKDLTSAISNNTSVKVTPVGGELVVYNLDGTEFTTVTKEKVKYTNETPVIALASAISLIGIAVIAKKSRKANA